MSHVQGSKQVRAARNTLSERRQGCLQAQVVQVQALTARLDNSADTGAKSDCWHTEGRLSFSPSRWQVTFDRKSESVQRSCDPAPQLHRETGRRVHCEIVLRVSANDSEFPRLHCYAVAGASGRIGQPWPAADLPH